MAKRFTDSEKWADPWFMDLPSKYKLLWLYLVDQCDHAGVWKVNFKVAQFYIGEHLEPSEVKRFMRERITFINDKYWHIHKFIEFQYKCTIEELNPNNKTHLSVLKILNNYEQFKPLVSPLLGVKDKDKDKDNIKNKEKDQNDYKKWVKLWNDVNGCNLRVTDGKRKQIKARLSTFTEEEIEQSIRNRSNDEWINGDGEKYKTNWDSFWRNDEKVEHYLNKQSEKPFDPSKSLYFQ